MSIRLLPLLLATVPSLIAAPQPPGDRSAIFLFGPAAADAAKQGAKGAASAGQKWLRTQGATLELRRAGNPDGVPITATTPSKDLELAFQNAARDSRDANPAVFISALDAAAQALALRPEPRILAAILESPPLSGESENALAQIVEFCRAHAIRIVVFELSVADTKKSGATLKAIAVDSGGAYARSGKALDDALLTSSSTAAPVNATAEAAAPPLETGDIPVHVRFLKTSPRGLQSFGVQRTHTGGRGGITTVDGGANMESAIGPMRGLLLVEAPLSAIHFNDEGTNYLGKVRVTQIVRNAKGEVSWKAAKDVVMRGPYQRLETRRTGNLYYMREVMLPGGRYTLEATVEDLLAQKTGSVRLPLSTGDGVPGFAVSDAVVVRRFSGAADRFEADQVFGYDGDAYSPLLAPVFRAGEPFDLRIFLTLYPDLYGGQPEMSLEVLHNGRVLGRTPLPFTDTINDTTKDSNRNSLGEQKHQFPYLATLKGAKLSAGEFEARVTIRQDRNLVTRRIPFRVLGNGETTATVAVAAGPNAPAAAPAEEELTEVVLPEIDPVSVARTGPSLAPEEQKLIWDEAAASAMSYSARLPNFRCEQETRRLTAPAGNPERMKERDTIVEELVYENGRENYRTLKVDGINSNVDRSEFRGVASRGEFGTMLRSLFSPEVAASYQWAGRAMAGGVLCRVFDIQVPIKKSNFVFYHNGIQEVAGYTGRVFLDEESGLVRRLTINGEGLPKKFAIQSPSFSLEYGLVRVGENDHLLPLRSVLQLRQGKTFVRNEAVFRGYRKFDASSEIKY